MLSLLYLKRMISRKRIGKNFGCIILIHFLTTIAVYSQVEHSIFDREKFYSSLASGNVDAINNELNVIHNTFIENKDAFEGVLLMKKAGVVNSKKEKLNLFKTGRNKLEGIINKNSSNAEFRFFRLMIQEHAPKFLKYHDDLENDRQYIRSSFKNLPAEVQQAILDYSKKSKILHTTDF